ncbi:hypothetical protein AK812_SmicGene34855 [Symbiodinium microadriaticum]|uniref:Uncharacterized protein n=1 Tax=Symbiodinium microadriaticum TaxID=2951 RepID=A0A1Q9CMY7_SYMMI|nr:hypothetical protein AK812_SmicGene34855 [Symbiodinium microadriaticum]
MLPTTLWKSFNYGINRHYSGKSTAAQKQSRCGYAGTRAQHPYTFDLPEWNFEDYSHRRAFFKLRLPRLQLLPLRCSRAIGLDRFEDPQALVEHQYLPETGYPEAGPYAFVILLTINH